MKLLVLGGPKFLGRYVIEAALAVNHEVTVFNRGQTHADAYPEVEKLRGNRDGDLVALHGRSWDAVIDTCGYVPRVVEDSARLLADTVGHYTFVSSISVYASTAVPGVDESAPVGILADEAVEEITGETYGPLKALCEQAVSRHFPQRANHIRAGLIVGPHDTSDRFTYWPMRLHRGGAVLAPGTPDTLVQLVDVRDLAGWMVQMATSQTAGTWNATGPNIPLTMGDLLTVCQQVSNPTAALTWVDDDFLLAQEVGSWIEMPLWIPASDADAPGFSAIDCRKAWAAGLAFRPLAETVRNTLDWAMQRGPDWQWRAGMKMEKETAVLQAWHNRSMVVG